ncbi:uncharacterized protein VTP21DRAFT_9993 [Calcarisporiella thermophila]|uniref:uncharacterized protein n=1 Tax=Calcarisporiella thermophila TaxID=911321 RepID=UPI0037423F73
MQPYCLGYYTKQKFSIELLECQKFLKAFHANSPLSQRFIPIEGLNPYGAHRQWYVRIQDTVSISVLSVGRLLYLGTIANSSYLSISGEKGGFCCGHQLGDPPRRNDSKPGRPIVPALFS